MARDFTVYKAEQLRKANAQRRAQSQPGVYAVPTLTKGEVLFVPAYQMEGEPATCYNCHMFNYERSCMLIGPHVAIRKFTYPPAPTGDAKPIEYWPCCGAWGRGKPNYGAEKFVEENDPDNLGLGWVNAPAVSQEIGGANCGGSNGGDECDHYITEKADSRATETGFCRVLQQNVENGAVCSAWRDDDWLTWQRGQDLLKELEGGRDDIEST